MLRRIVCGDRIPRLAFLEASQMENGGKAAALGAVAAAAVFGAKGLLEATPKLATGTIHIAEISASKATILEGATSLSSGVHGISSGSEKLAGPVQSQFDRSASLAATMHTGRLAESDANPYTTFNDSVRPRTDRPNAISKAPITPSRPIVFLGNQDLSRSGISSYFSIAEPKLENDLTKLTPPLSKANVESIVRGDLQNAADATKKDHPESKITFEYLSGKLTIGSSTTVSGVRITGGEVNVYNVSAAIAGGVMTCNALADASFKRCVDLAIKTALSSFVKEAKTHDAPLSAE
jgi:hypothetical protein